MSGTCIASPGGLRGTGGIQSYTRTIAARLAHDFPERTIAVVDPRGPSAWTSPLWLAAAIARLCFLALTGRVDVLHLQVSERTSFARKGALGVVARALGLRVVLHHHGAELIPFLRGASAPVRRSVRAFVRAADENVVLGGIWARFLVEEMGVRPARVTVLPNALDDAPAPRREARGTRPLRVLFLAVMTRRKGARTLLAALAELAARGVPFEAVFAGDGPDLPACREEAVRLGLGGRCRFPGMVAPDEAARLMARADVYVCASENEGLPIAILEALRAGTPVLSTPVGAIAEAVPDGDGALHFPVGDSAALAALLTGLATDRGRLAALSAAARRAFEGRFRLAPHMARLRRIYRWEGDDARALAR